DSSCTSDTVNRTIAVHAKPTADFALPAVVCMPGGIATFTNNSKSPDNASMSYQWNFGDLTNNVSAQNPIHIYTNPGHYPVTLIARTSFGCIGDTSKTLSAFVNKPVAVFAVSPDTLCQGTSNVFADLSPIPSNPVESWNWNFGDGTFSNSSSPVKTYSKPGNFIISLTVKNASGCISDPYLDTVVVYLQPKITAGPSFVVPEGSIIHFNPAVNDSSVVDFRWTPSGDFPDPDILRPTIAALHNQQYTLTATGQGNCSATSSLTVRILKPVAVPNSFSPNGDGINDTWKIPNLADYPGCNVEVYNRYGQMVYKSFGYSNPWDGKYNGSVLPFGTYYYIITLKNGFTPVTGSVTIVK
ncbi:MAG: PKD domain-containing protein, partial [Flavisolibacter sp.]